ncbi:MAG: hypothetical protein WCO84_01555 [bacterium]
MELNYTLNFASNSEVAKKLVDMSIDVTMASLSEDFGQTGLVSKFSLDNRHEASRMAKEGVLSFAAEKAGIEKIETKSDVIMAFANPIFENIVNAIQAETLMGVMARVQSAQILGMANIATVDIGDSYTWEIDPKGLPIAQRASYLSNVTVDQSFLKKSITVTPQQYSLGTTLDYVRVLANDYDWGKQLARVAMGMLYAQYKLIVSLLFDVSGTPIYKGTFAVKDYVKMASDLNALNGGAGVTAYGTLPAWQAINAVATSGGFTTIDEYIRNNFLQKIFGIDSMIIDQATDFSAPLTGVSPTVLVPEDHIVLLSSVGDKPVKLVRENFIRVIKSDHTSTSQNKVSYSYFMAFDAALATQAHFGLQHA